MYWQQIQGKWQEHKGRAKQRWGRLTDKELTLIDGKRDVLAGRIRSSYGHTKERVEDEIAEFETACQACNTARLAGTGQKG